MKIFITQYGKSKSSGGWDPDGDKYTDQFIGNHGNVIYSGVSCALNALSVKGLDATVGCWLRVDFGRGQVYIRRYDDTAPETDKPRLDLFNYLAFDKQIAEDYAEVTLLTDPELSAVPTAIALK